MPKRLAVARIESQKVSLRVACESQPRVCRQHSRARPLGANFMAPANLACLVVNGLNHALAPPTVIRARPAVESIRRLGKIKAIAGLGVNDKQAVPSIKAR